jgi:hypothetical protein
MLPLWWLGATHQIAVSLLWWHSSDRRVSHITTLEACGTSAVATSRHSSDGLSDISGPLLLAPTVPMGCLTSVACCY